MLNNYFAAELKGELARRPGIARNDPLVRFSWPNRTTATLPLVGRWEPRSGRHVDLTTHLREGGRLPSRGSSVDNDKTILLTYLYYIDTSRLLSD